MVAVRIQECGRCKELKPLSQYVPSGRGVQGQYCAPCRSAYRRERHESVMAVQRIRRAGGKIPRKYEVCQNPGCGSSLEHKRSNAKYCSLECQHAVGNAPTQAARLAARGGEPWQPESNECEWCGADLSEVKRVSPHLRLRFCSKVCWKQWFTSRPEYQAERRDYQCRAVYNMRKGQYAEMLAAQGGVCANPGCSNPATDVDHDHSCCDGQRSCGTCVRALLCSGCNNALGRLRDDVTRVEGLAAYLRGWQSRREGDLGLPA
jgi:hypothetical protein